MTEPVFESPAPEEIHPAPATFTMPLLYEKGIGGKRTFGPFGEPLTWSAFVTALWSILSVLNLEYGWVSAEVVAQVQSSALVVISFVLMVIRGDVTPGNNLAPLP